jgi:hypothetical protein
MGKLPINQGARRACPPRWRWADPIRFAPGVQPASSGSCTTPRTWLPRKLAFLGTTISVPASLSLSWYVRRPGRVRSRVRSRVRPPGLPALPRAGLPRREDPHVIDQHGPHGGGIDPGELAGRPATGMDPADLDEAAVGRALVEPPALAVAVDPANELQGAFHAANITTGHEAGPRPSRAAGFPGWGQVGELGAGRKTQLPPYLPPTFAM